ncbi:MAG: hypothetical protein WC711_01190 [Candidatus Staskawiczbacteria bacterium]|jgi:hypothetical protein
MEKEKLKILKNSVVWGIGLWFIGWVLGIVAFMVVPVNMIGWVVSPIGIIITLWVLFKKINRDSLQCYFGLGVVWTVIAVILDYLFLVLLFKPADGYYKLDVYLYYITTLILPIIVGLIKFRKQKI